MQFPSPRRIAGRGERVSPRNPVAAELSPARSAARTEHWTPLLQWSADPAPELPAEVLELIEVTPEEPRDRVELLHLALIAVSLDRTRLAQEFELRAPLDLPGGPSTSALVEYQCKLTVDALGTAGPLGALDAAMRLKIEQAAPALVDSIRWEGPQPHLWSSPAELAVAWSAALRFSGLAHDLGCMLGLPARVPFRRFLRLSPDTDVLEVLPNAVSCFNEPWKTGDRRVHTRTADGCEVFEMLSPAAGIVAVAHNDSFEVFTGNSMFVREFRARRHPSREVGEAGHPVLAAVPPLAVQWTAPTAPTRSPWRHLDRHRADVHERS